jgi:hypothetical protein
MTDSTHRKEGIKRVQVGLTGLAGIVLMIGLVNIVVNNVRSGTDSRVETATLAANAADANADSGPQEPLAELGVTPSADVDVSVVPDLKPDPKLRKPMDRDAARSVQP